MRRKVFSLAAACALLLPLACDDTRPSEPTSPEPSFAAGGNGLHLRDTDANAPIPADTSVALNDTIRMALAAGNGNGPQNNKNVVWTNSNPAAVALTSNKGTAVAVGQALGTSTVCAKLGGNSHCVVIHVTAGAGVAYVVTSSSYTPTAGTSVTISAQLVDVSNNPAAQAGRIVTWSSSTGGSFAPATSLTDANGIATTSFTVSSAAGTVHVVTATDNFAATGSSAPIVVQPGAAANMVADVGDGQSATVGTAVAVAPTVRVTDAFNNPVAGVPVTFTVASGGGSVTGAAQVTDANGFASVGSWTLGTTPGTNTLDATSPGLPTVTFTATATVGGATALAMHTQPSATAQAGVAFAQQPAVQLKDAFDNDVATAGVVVTASIASGTGTLAGTLTATTDANGRATFTDLRIDGAAGTRTLRFQASGVSDAISDPIAVGAGPADHLVMVQQPSSTAQAGVAFSQQPSVRIVDQFGNVVMQSGVQVDVAIASGGGSLLGTASVNTDANGVASWSDLAIGGTIGQRTLSFTAAGVAGVVSDPIDVTAGPAADILLFAPATSVTVNTVVTISGQLRDQYGNNVPQVTSVSWSSTNGGSFQTNPTTTNGSGQTTVDFTVSAVGGVTHVITATAGSASGTLSISTVNTAPTAVDDAFDAIGNVTIPVAAPGVLANDSDPEQPISAVPGTIATSSGGTVTMNADGSFTYLSAPGFTGTDDFTYTVTDGSDTGSAQVTMNVNVRVWYVRNDATAPGDGRDVSPFVLLADAEAASAPNDRVLVFAGNGTSSGYDAGFTFKPGQSLIGQGIPTDLTATVNGDQIVLLPAGTAPQVTNAAPGTTLQLSTANTLRGIDVGSTAGDAIEGGAVVTFMADAVSVNATGGAGLDLSGGAATVTLDALSATGGAQGIRLAAMSGSVSVAGGAIAGTSVSAIDVNGGDVLLSYGGDVSVTAGAPLTAQSMTGGGITASGNITSTGSGVSIQNNTGASFSFTGASKAITPVAGTAVSISANANTQVSFSGGGLAIATTGATAFDALNNTGPAGISVTGAGNTIAAMSGVALNVTSSVIDAAGLGFTRIDAAGGANGIVLNGASGGALTVTGSGGACTAAVPTCTGGTITGSSVIGVHLVNASAHLTGMRISNAAGAGVFVTGTSDHSVTGSLIQANGDSNGENGMQVTNASGSIAVNSTSFHGAGDDLLRVANNSGSLTLVVQNSSFEFPLPKGSVSASSAIELLPHGTTALDATISDNTFRNIVTTSLNVFASGGASTSSSVTFTNNSISNDAGLNVSCGTNPECRAGNVVVAGVAGNVDFIATGNEFTRVNGDGVVVLSTSNDAIVSARVETNEITDAIDDAVVVGLNQNGRMILQFNNNTMSQIGGEAFEVASGEPAAPFSGDMDLVITNNTIDNHGFSSQAFTGGIAIFRFGDADQQVCLALTGNTITNTAPGMFDVFIEGNFGGLGGSILYEGAGAGAVTDVRIKADNPGVTQANVWVADTFLSGGSTCLRPSF